MAGNETEMIRTARAAVITGAAGGIGQALVKAYAESGCLVWMTDMDAVRGEQVLQHIRSELPAELAGNIRWSQADLRDPEAITQLLTTAAEQFGRIDILINNAGIGRTMNPYELTVEDWDDVLFTNLRGTFLCSREAAKRMKQQPEGGHIVNISSTRATMSEPNTEAYAASKGGIIALTHALAISLGPDRILVNSISPGWIDAGDGSDLKETDHKQHPAGRVGRPEDVVKACLYLTDPDNRFVTGVNLVVDGGMTRKMIYEP
ncbi:SDR family NAD(P)-dependent oxidoreductase [Paenibacillus sp. GCM10023252]|uniref:SDR family NAD(P)-dependent oxidoreductase n=1 Tax=Paenibacillus sp. GCM10023252 TaxID=3252649 RepID=UPI0036070085